MTEQAVTQAITHLLKIPCSEHRDEVVKAATGAPDALRLMAVWQLENFLLQNPTQGDRHIVDALVTLRRVQT